MNVLIQFMKPQKSLGARAITWEPEEAPAHLLASALRGLTPEIVGEGYERLVEMFGRGLGNEEDGVVYTSGEYGTYCIADVDPEIIIISNDYSTDESLTIRANSMLECIEALHRAFWYRTREYVLVNIETLDIDSNVPS